MQIWGWGDPIDALRRTLDRGGVLAIPTESSYGLAVDPRQARGVKAIYAIKERDAGKPLLVVLAELDQLLSLGVPPAAPEIAVAAAHWPAALTILFPLSEALPATAGEKTLAARIPAHPELRGLLRRLGHPLTATSANLSGRPPILDPQNLKPFLAGHEAVVVDGGRLAGGPASTLVGWPGGELHVLRAGAYPVEKLPRFLPPA